MKPIPELGQPIVIEEVDGKWTASIILPFAIAGEQPVLGYGDSEIEAVRALGDEAADLSVNSTDSTITDEAATALELAKRQIAFALTGQTP